MKIVVFGKDTKNAERLLSERNFEIVSEMPDVVVSCGGDGTLILSEFHFPGVPKLPLRSSRVCKLCAPFENEEVLDLFAKDAYSTRNLTKLDISANGTKLHGVNDVMVHNADPRHAIRYRVSINGKERFNHEIIGDGVVVATPFGSSGYYRSITGSIFSAGLGLAFNNSTESFDHMVLKEDDAITLTITRGPARAYADNQEEYIELSEGDVVEIRKSLHSARLVVVGNV